MAPLYSTFLAWCVLKEPIHATHILCLIIAIVGGILVAKPAFMFGGSTKTHGGADMALVGYIEN